MKRKTILFVFVIFALGFLYLTHSSHANAKHTIIESKPDPNQIQPADNTFTSEIVKADYPFNSFGMQWKIFNSNQTSSQIFFRVSSDTNNWSEWLTINGEKDETGYFSPESPVFIEGNFYQYKIALQANQSIENVKVTYIDSTANVKSLPTKRSTQSLATGAPNILSRADWGSPDPYGYLLKETGDPDHGWWYPQYKPVTQIFIHHTVNKNVSPDYAAIVRGIWEFHTYSRVWGDIGYNYLVDPNGNIYEGRFGGENAIAGHVAEFNPGSLGVALIGCYDSNHTDCKTLNNNNVTPPSAAMVDSLTTLLTWKSKQFEIDPLVQHEFCSYTNDCRNLYTISGHRDVGLTTCPGNLVYDLLPTIREQVNTKKSSMNFAYAAKQMTYPKISRNQTSVTFKFKNEGSATWSNSQNIVSLRTGNPIGRNSVFQGYDWVSPIIAANLQETSVPPGSTGTFTFHLSNTNTFFTDYYESFSLVAEGIGAFGGYYNLSVLLSIDTWSLQPGNATTQINTVSVTNPNDTMICQSTRGLNNDLITRRAFASSGLLFSEWFVGGKIQGEVVLATLNNKIIQSVRGTDDGIYTRVSTDCANWSDWQFSGMQSGNPSLGVATINNQRTIFQSVRGTDNFVYTRSSLNGINWTDWEKSIKTFENITLSEFQPNGSIPYIYQSVKGESNEIFTRRSWDGKNWSDWQNGGKTSGQIILTPISVSEKRLIQSVRGTDNIIYNRYSANGVDWSNWSFGGQTLTNISNYFHTQNGYIYQSVKGTDSNIYTRFSNDGINWGSWENSGPTVSQIGIFPVNHQIFQAIQGSNNKIYLRRIL